MLYIYYTWPRKKFSFIVNDKTVPLPCRDLKTIHFFPYQKKKKDWQDFIDLYSFLASIESQRSQGILLLAPQNFHRYLVYPLPYLCYFASPVYIMTESIFISTQPKEYVSQV